jgi:hypothetical protein
MEKEKNKETERPEAYPKPSQQDSQFQNQNEFIDEKPNEFEETSVSNAPGVAKRNEDIEEKK